MFKPILFSLSLLSATLAFAQEAVPVETKQLVIPDEAKQFIIPGYEPLNYTTGDINGDKRKDALLVLKRADEDNVDSFNVEEPANRPMLVLVRQADGKLKQVARNDEAIMCRQCGGVFGDPFDNIQVGVNSFTLHFYGGSNWRWTYDYRFTYKPAKKGWYLTKETQSNFNSFDPDKTMQNTSIDEPELGAVSFDKFSTDGHSGGEQKWKVKAVKTFFYDNPKIGSKPRKAYLLKGDVAGGIRELANFVEVSFTDSKENVTYGYVLKKDLVKAP